MIICPACSRQHTNVQDFCRCGADLRLLHQLNSLADAWFNKGLDLAAAGKPGEALMWFSACCTARPSDAAAWLALAQLWGQLGHWREGFLALDRAREIDPELDGISRTEAGLEKLKKE